jgi:hypothetical protein
MGDDVTEKRAEVEDFPEMKGSDRPRQLLHLVFGGELESLQGKTFRDLDQLDLVGIFPDYASAEKAWRAKAQATVDNAHTRYFIVHLHRLLDPETGDQSPG